jgi:hypothetical protein
LDERSEQVPCADHQAAGAQDDPWHSSDDRVAAAQGGQSGSLDDRVAVESDEQWGWLVRHQSQPDAAENQFDQWQEDEATRVSHRRVSREERLLARKSPCRIWPQAYQPRVPQRQAPQQQVPQQVSQ